MEMCSLKSSLLDVMNNAMEIHPKRYNHMVIVSRVKIQYAIVEIQYEEWGATALSSLVRSSGIKQGDMLEITSAIFTKTINAGSDIYD